MAVVVVVVVSVVGGAGGGSGRAGKRRAREKAGGKVWRPSVARRVSGDAGSTPTTSGPRPNVTGLCSHLGSLSPCDVPLLPLLPSPPPCADPRSFSSSVTQC